MKPITPKPSKEKKAIIHTIVIRNVSRKPSQCYYKKLEGFKAEDLVFWADYIDILRESGKINSSCAIIKREYGNINKIIIQFTNSKKEAAEIFERIDQYLLGMEEPMPRT